MTDCNQMLEPSAIDTDKLRYEIFSILETKFLFGCNSNNNNGDTNNNNNNGGDTTTTNDGRQKLSWMISKQISPRVHPETDAIHFTPPPVAASTGHQSLKNQRGKVCILSIDGGGMRNILPGKALAHLEQALKANSGNPDARIADYFDVAAGAGIGGIFAAMLFATKDDAGGRPRPIFSAEDTWRLLAEKGRKMYRSGGSGTGSASGGKGVLKRIMKSGGGSAGLERLMKEAFVRNNGQSLTLKDTVKPVLIPCYDLSSAAPFLFSRADALETDSFDFRLWEVCRATSAEPGVFEPVSMRSVDGSTRCVGIDGGLAMSNPTAAAITHVLHNKEEFPFVRGMEDILVLSLGTSGQLVEGSYNVYEQVKGWKARQWTRAMARIAGEGHSDLVDQAVGMAFGHCRSNDYVRIQANGSSLGLCGPNVDTDPSPDNVKMLVGVAEEMLMQKNVESVLFGGTRISEQSNSEKLHWFAGELVLEHERRTCRIAPTVAFKQVTPKPRPRLPPEHLSQETNKTKGKGGKQSVDRSKERKGQRVN